jgi:hypothetical protein
MGQETALVVVGTLLLLGWLGVIAYLLISVKRLLSDRFEFITYPYFPLKVFLSTCLIGSALVRGFIALQWWFQNLEDPALGMVAEFLENAVFRPIALISVIFLLWTPLTKLLKKTHRTIGDNLGEVAEGSSPTQPLESFSQLAPSFVEYEPAGSPVDQRMEGEPRAPGTSGRQPLSSSSYGMPTKPRDSLDRPAQGEELTHSGPFIVSIHDGVEYPAKDGNLPRSEKIKDRFHRASGDEVSWFVGTRLTLLKFSVPWVAFYGLFFVLYLAFAIVELQTRTEPYPWCESETEYFNRNLVSCRAVISATRFKFMLPTVFAILGFLFRLPICILWARAGYVHGKRLLQKHMMLRFYHLYAAVLGLLLVDLLLVFVQIFPFARTGWPHVVVDGMNHLVNMTLYCSLLGRIVRLTEASDRATK